MDVSMGVLEVVDDLEEMDVDVTMGVLENQNFDKT